MRKQMKIFNGERIKIYAKFERFGKKNGYKGPVETVLLIDLKTENNYILADHLWFNKTKGFSEINLKQGDEIEFFGRVKTYEKGYKGYNYEKIINSPISLDYKISHPTKIKKIIN